MSVVLGHPNPNHDQTSGTQWHHWTPAPSGCSAPGHTVAMAAFQGEECPYRLVHETETDADGTPKELSSQNMTAREGGYSYVDPPPANECAVAWNIMRKADSSLAAHHGPQKWHSMRAIEVMKAVYQIDRAFNLGWHLYQVVAHALERLPRKYCTKECRGLPQYLPIFPPRPADGKFVLGAWYYYRRKDMYNFVVAQIVARRTGKAPTRKEVLRVRLLTDHVTAYGTQVQTAAYRSLTQDAHIAEMVKGTCSNKPLSLARVSEPFEKTMQRKAGACKCCGCHEPHDQVIVGGSTICAFHRVQRGGIAV